MKILIEPTNNMVMVDNVARTVDLSDIGTGIDYIRFDSDLATGLIVYLQDEARGRVSDAFGGRYYNTFYAKYWQAWRLAGGPAIRSLSEAKADKRAQINSHRDVLEQAGFPYMNKMFDSNTISVQRISTAALSALAAIAAGEDLNIEWVVQDNSTILLNAAQLAGMPAALAAYAGGLHGHARVLKSLIDGANTMAELDAIEW